jgi:AbrB family looped-hinge helix DNA binding protein
MLVWYYGVPIDMPAVTVSPKYQIVIPKAVREKYSLRPGDKVEVIELDGRIELVPIRPVKALKGFIKGLKNTFERESDRCLP